MTEPKYNQAFIDVGEGQPVLLLHGLFGKVSMWKRTIEGLRKNFRVVVPRFEVPVEQADIRRLSAHLHEFIEWHRLGDVYLVGHGIGGQLALMYASEHPRNVNKIVVSGSDLFPNEELDVTRLAEHDEYEVGEKVRSAFYNSYLAGPALVNKIYRTLEDESSRATIEHLIRSSADAPVESMLNKLNIV
jgi:2-hydroxy-6-oxonona-2,4-dienedioate hydrolase